MRPLRYRELFLCQLATPRLNTTLPHFFSSGVLYKYTLVGIFLELRAQAWIPVPIVYVICFLKLYPKGAPRSIKQSQGHPVALLLVVLSFVP